MRESSAVEVQVSQMSLTFVGTKGGLGSGTGKVGGARKVTSESALGFTDAEVARLLQGREGFVDATDGEFVGLDVEVADCVVDQLMG